MRSIRTLRSASSGVPNRRFRRSSIPRLAVAAAAVALLAAGCGADDSTQAGNSTESANSGPVLDSSVFDGEAQTVSGDSFELASLANKDLVVWFWAPW